MQNRPPQPKDQRPPSSDTATNSTQPNLVSGYTIPMIIHGRTLCLNWFVIFFTMAFSGSVWSSSFVVLIDCYVDPFNSHAVGKH